MIVYFGEIWDAPIMENARPWGSTPTYAHCARCNDLFVEGDQGLVTPVAGFGTDDEHIVDMRDAPPDLTASWGITRGVVYLVAYHRECQLAGIMGHIMGVCSCTGYGFDRDSAREVLRRVRAKGGV